MRLKYGMVGGGPESFIGDAHRKAISMDNSAQLVAGVFSRSFDKTIETGKRFDIAEDRCYPDFQSMANAESNRKDGIDFVVVVTPNVSHYDICKAFMEAGIHVACDKPLCLTIGQAEELTQLAQKKDLLFMTTYTYMGHATTKYIKEYIKTGKLGKVRCVIAEYPQGWLAYEGKCGGKQGEWRCDPKQSGGVNCLGDLGTHVENIATSLTGLKIKRVLARMDKVVPGRALDDNDYIIVEYDNGATGLFWTSQIAIGHENSLKLRIYGEKGSIKWFQEESEKVTVIAEDGTSSEFHRGDANLKKEANVSKYVRLPAGHTEGCLEAMANLYQSFTETIVAQKIGAFSPELIDYPTVQDGAEGVRFIEACIKSNNNNNIWVEV